MRPRGRTAVSIRPISVLIASDFGLYPSSYVRLMNPLHAERIPYCFRKTGDVSSKDLRDCTVLVLQRCVSQGALMLMIEAFAQGKPVIYELDDWLIDLESESYTQFSSEEQENVITMMRLATRVVCSTERLREKIAPITDNITVIKNRAQPIGLLKPLSREIRMAVVNTDYFKLGAGSADFCSAVEQSLRQFPTATITFWGGLPREAEGLRRASPERVNIISDYVPQHARYMARLIELRPSIMLVPLEATPTHACKSLIKYLDAATLGVPSICSNVAPYSEELQDGSTVLLANNTREDWTKKLARLLGSSDLRREIGRNAFRNVSMHHNLIDSAREWAELLQQSLRQAHNLKLDALRPLLALRMSPDLNVDDSLTIANALRRKAFRLLYKRGMHSLVDAPSKKVYFIRNGVYRHVWDEEAMRFFFPNTPLHRISWLEETLALKGRVIRR